MEHVCSVRGQRDSDERVSSVVAAGADNGAAAFETRMVALIVGHCSTRTQG